MSIAKNACTTRYGDLSAEERLSIVTKLRHHAEQALGYSVDAQGFEMSARAHDALIGAIVGKIYLNWLYLDHVFVEESHRRMKIGSSLMHACENWARAHGITGIEVWTQSWQAPEFYVALGYTPFAVVEEVIPGMARHGFRRVLTETAT